jgi:hypothetical protein
MAPQTTVDFLQIFSAELHETHHVFELKLAVVVDKPLHQFSQSLDKAQRILGKAWIA